MIPLPLHATPAQARRRTPSDVVHFLDRREGCDHWTGEEGYDPARRREISAAIRDLRCADVKRDLCALLRRYARQADVITLLDR